MGVGVAGSDEAVLAIGAAEGAPSDERQRDALAFLRGGSLPPPIVQE